MHATKLIQLLQSIQPDELRWLAKWIRSPYYNTDKSVIDLFDYVRKYAPAYTSRKLAKQTIFEHLFPNESYNDRRLRVCMFRLSGLVEGFLVAQRLKRDRFSYEQHLHAELGERNQYDLFERKNRELEQQLEESPYRDADHYLARWQLQHDHFFHLQTQRYGVEASHLDEIMQQLDTFYILSKLRYSAELLNRQNILAERHEIMLLDESRKIASSHPLYAEDIVFRMYNDLLLLMDQPEDEAVFLRLFDHVKRDLRLFRQGDQAMFLRYLINVTIQLYQRGKHAFLNYQFELYQLGLKYDLFLSEGQLSDSTFLNIVITAATLNKLDWIEGFTANYAPLLPQTSQADAVNLGTAYWYFAKGRFTSSKDLLRQIESNDLQYQLRIKSLSLRNDFELYLQDESYYELFVYESRAFEKFLRRDERLSEKRIRAYLQFVLFLRKIASHRSSLQLTAEKIAGLKAQLAAEDSMIAKQWLDEKLDSL